MGQRHLTPMGYLVHSCHIVEVALQMQPMCHPEQAPKNFTLIIIDNGVYEVTGNQATIGSATKRAGQKSVDYGALARAAGFEEVYEFDDVESWRYEQEIMHEEGPICIVLKTTNRTEDVGARSPGPAPQRAQALREALCGAA